MTASMKNTHFPSTIYHICQLPLRAVRAKNLSSSESRWCQGLNFRELEIGKLLCFFSGAWVRPCLACQVICPDGLAFGHTLGQCPPQYYLALGASPWILGDSLTTAATRAGNWENNKNDGEIIIKMRATNSTGCLVNTQEMCQMFHIQSVLNLQTLLQPSNLDRLLMCVSQRKGSREITCWFQS